MKACIDIGGTKLAVSLARGRELAFKRTEPTAKSGAPDRCGRGSYLGGLPDASRSLEEGPPCEGTFPW